MIDLSDLEAKARAALAKYGHHQCSYVDIPDPCTCGLDEALR